MLDSWVAKFWVVVGWDFLGKKQKPIVRKLVAPVITSFLALCILYTVRLLSAI